MTTPKSCKLTDAKVRGLEPGDARYSVTDTVIPGLQIRVTPTGIKSWSLMYWTADGRRRRFTIGKFPAFNCALARRRARELLGNVAIGGDPQADKLEDRAERKRQAEMPTLREFLDGEFATWAQAHRKSADDTVRRIKNAYADLLDKRLFSITTWQLDKVRAARLKAGIKSVERDRMALSSLFERAIKGRYITSNPAREQDNLKLGNNQRVRYLSPGEERRLRVALAQRDKRLAKNGARFYDHLTPLVIVALHTGLRRGELLTLRWADVDLRARTITVRATNTKSATQRTVPLGVKPLLYLRYLASHATSDYVFVSRTGRPMKSIKTAWGGLMTAAKLRDFRFHDCRHHFASRLVQRGVDLAVVRELLGHADFKLTLRYAHLAHDQKREAVMRLVG